MATYLINSTGQEIIAEQPFMDEKYPGNYTLVTPDSAPTLPTILTNVAFMARIATAAGESALASILQQAQSNATLDIFVVEEEEASSMDLTDPKVSAGLAELVSLNIITSAQSTQISALPTLPSEQPK